MKHVFQKRLLRSVVGIALMAYVRCGGSRRKRSLFRAHRRNAPSFAGAGSSRQVRAGLNQAPRVEENGTCSAAMTRIPTRLANLMATGADSGDWNRDGRATV